MTALLCMGDLVRENAGCQISKTVQLSGTSSLDLQFTPCQNPGSATTSVNFVVTSVC